MAKAGFSLTSEQMEILNLLPNVAKAEALATLLTSASAEAKAAKAAEAERLAQANAAEAEREAQKKADLDELKEEARLRKKFYDSFPGEESLAGSRWQKIVVFSEEQLTLAERLTTKAKKLGLKAYRDIASLYGGQTETTMIIVKVQLP